MKTGRDAMGVAFMGDRLFIVGGFDGQAYLNFVEAYDPLTNTWQQVANHQVIITIPFPTLLKVQYFAVRSASIWTCWCVYCCCQRYHPSGYLVIPQMKPCGVVLMVCQQFSIPPE